MWRGDRRTPSNRCRLVRLGALEFRLHSSVSTSRSSNPRRAPHFLHPVGGSNSSTLMPYKSTPVGAELESGGGTLRRALFLRKTGRE